VKLVGSPKIVKIVLHAGKFGVLPWERHDGLDRHGEGARVGGEEGDGNRCNGFLSYPTRTSKTLNLG
jgi:hypothetical protein